MPGITMVPLCRIAAPQGGIAILAAHLEYRDENTRSAAASTILELADRDGLPFMAVGDFNSIECTGAAIDFLLGEGFIPADSARKPTFPSGAPDRKFDWILFRDPLRAMSASVNKSRLSDHLMLVAEIEQE